MRDFRKIKVWQKAHQFTLSVYRSTEVFPTTERYGLVAQLRRAALSVGAHIAEGCGRSGDADFARFLIIAFGSASESEYPLLVALDLGYLKETAHARLQRDIDEIKRMLSSFIKKLRAER